MDPFLASPYPSTAQILNHKVLLRERQHFARPSKLLRGKEICYRIMQSGNIHVSKINDLIECMKCVN
jgi:hypothetical protein